MKRFIIVVILGFFAWQGYTRYQSNTASETASQAASENFESSSLPLSRDEVISTSQFKCDGRTYCSQMTSCAEATYFLQNCPGVKMDGNNDGTPCEQQWCTNSR
jgi:predicted negative regulator of RcsB-dependent stress response